MKLRVPIKIIMNINKEHNIDTNAIVTLFSKNNMLPDYVNSQLYSSKFIKKKKYKTYNKISLFHLKIELECSKKEINDALLKKLGKMKKIIEGKIRCEKIYIQSSNNFLVGWDDLNFHVYSIKLDISKFEKREIDSELSLEGKINKNIVNEYRSKEHLEIINKLQLLGGGPIDSDKESLKGIESHVAPNFIFIRSLLDFINSAPSESFSKAFLSISKKYPFLFKPKDKFWKDILGKDEDKQIKILFPLLNQARGLTRVDFNYFIKYWRNMIIFLQDFCDGNASNFFINCCKKLGLDHKDKHSVESLQHLLETYKEIRSYLGIDFPYSYKAGRLLFTMMTKNPRGFDLLNGINNEQLYYFNLPVDSQVLRVALNTGLVEINYIKTKKTTHNKKTTNGLMIKRSDMTEICQKAWKIVAERLNITSIELDYMIFSVGSLVCNRFGKNCYCCPITEKCNSWKNKTILEGSGVDWHKNGAFSYGKGEFDALIFRCCDNSGNPKSCKDSFYRIIIFEEKQDKIDLEKLKNKYS